MPERNFLVVGGDFNLPLPMAPSWTGTPLTVPHPEQLEHAREGNSLLHLLERHSTQAVNTFHCRPCFTYQHCDSRTQIDYILVRRQNATGRSKRARPI